MILTSSELLIKSLSEWVCPEGIKQVILYENRVNFKVINVTSALTYLVLIQDNQVLFGNHFIQLKDSNSEPKLLFISKP